MSSSRAPSCTSPKMPRFFTLVSTRLRSPTPVARFCISPRPRCTASSRSETSLNDWPRRVSSVLCSFSSTVARICSSLAALSCLHRAELGLQRGAHLAHAFFVVGGECGQALLLLLAEAGQREGEFLAAAVGVAGQPLGQLLQAGVGAFGELAQALAEAVDALGLLLRYRRQLLAHVDAEAVEALLQFFATGALFLAQRALQAFAVVLERVQPRCSGRRRRGRAAAARPAGRVPPARRRRGRSAAVRSGAWGDPGKRARSFYGLPSQRFGPGRPETPRRRPIGRIIVGCNRSPRRRAGRLAAGVARTVPGAYVLSRPS